MNYKYFKGGVRTVIGSLLFAAVTSAFAVDSSSLPVDLNGRYYETKGDGASGTNFAFAATAGDEGATALAVSGGSGATDHSFTPFSSGTKPPTSLRGNLLDRSYQLEVDLSGTWTQNGADGFGSYPLRHGSTFLIGAHAAGGYFGGGGLAEIAIDKPFDGGGYRFDLSTSPGDVIVTDTTGATKFLVTVTVGSGGTMSANVVTIDGSSPGTSYPLSNPGQVTTGLDDAYFYAGWNRYYSDAANGNGQAKIAVSGFTTDMFDNAMYTFCGAPYCQPGNQFSYSWGMSNLTTSVVGWQAFGTNSGTPTLVNLGSAGAYYTASPFNIPITDPRAPGFTFSSAALSGTTSNAVLANSPFLSVIEDVATAGILASNGVTPTRFSKVGGGELLPGKLQGSNVVVIDGTPPSLSSLTATQTAGSIISSTAIQGNIAIAIDAKDVGAFPSGLSSPPTVTVTYSDASFVTLNCSAGVGDNYTTSTAITSSTPCGPATISVTATDDAGNVATTTAGFTVNKSQISVTVNLVNVTASPTRWIQFVVGGSGGGSGPITINKVLNFTSGSASVVLTALDGLPDCTASLTKIWAKDPVHTLGRGTNLIPGGNAQYTCAPLNLLGGNANGDTVCDILDFGVLAFQYGSSQNPNSAISDPGNADFDCNGTVGIVDFSGFLQVNYLKVDDALPGNFIPGGKLPKEKCTIAEMVGAGVPEAVAKAMDFNKDGWITTKEVMRYLEIKRNGGAGIH